MATRSCCVELCAAEPKEQPPQPQTEGQKAKCWFEALSLLGERDTRCARYSRVFCRPANPQLSFFSILRDWRVLIPRSAAQKHTRTHTHTYALISRTTPFHLAHSFPHPTLLARRVRSATKAAPHISIMGESRTELIAWINTLLSLSYTKIEQLGSGAAYAQVIDSIYFNVPLSKIKFDAKHEYEYLANYKVLQEAFKRNRIDKPIPVDRLVRCKMQDNLEFAQWLKKFWDQHFAGEAYDAEGRRGGIVAAPPPLVGAVSVGAARTAAAPAARSATKSAPAPGIRRAPASVPNETIQALTAQMDEMKVSVDSLEKERDFYFAKLRDIEILVQERLAIIAEQNPQPEAQDEVATEEQESLKQIQAILYSTEEGFEVPEGTEAAQDEEEMF